MQTTSRQRLKTGSGDTTVSMNPKAGPSKDGNVTRSLFWKKYSRDIVHLARADWQPHARMLACQRVTKVTFFIEPQAQVGKNNSVSLSRLSRQEVGTRRSAFLDILLN